MTGTLRFKEICKAYPTLTKRSQIGRAGEYACMDYLTCHCTNQNWKDLNAHRLNGRGFDIQCKSCGIMYQIKTGTKDILKYVDPCIPCGKRHVIEDCLEKFAGKVCFSYVCYDPDNFSINYIVQSNIIDEMCLDPIHDAINLKYPSYWVYDKFE